MGSSHERMFGAALAAGAMLIALALPAIAQMTQANIVTVPGAPKIGDPPEASNMRLVGYNDLQHRSAYQPTIHHQGNRYIAYIGHHGGTEEIPKPLNPVTGQGEFSGTSIVDVTDPAHPQYLAHIPGTEGTYEAGGAQMTRVCDGKALPKGDPNKTYLLRVFGGKSHEIYDVSDPAHPLRIWQREGELTDTHKSFWECDTGIAYLVSGVPGWRVKRMTEVYDLSDPAHPVKIRDFGLPGQQPGATGPIPEQLHGMISLGPQANRIYFGYGTNKGGMMQIVDREKLLNGPKEPTPENLAFPEVGRLVMTPWNGAHTVFPMPKMPIAEFAKDKEGSARDIVMIVDEQIRNECEEPRQMAWFVDVTIGASDGGVKFPGPGGERQFLRARRPLRHPRVEREHGAGFLQEDRVSELLQCRRARRRRPRSLSSEGDRLFHSLDHRGDRQALHQSQRRGSLQDRDPDQQCRDRRSRLHLHRRSRQYRDAHSRAHRCSARRRRAAMMARRKSTGR